MSPKHSINATCTYLRRIAVTSKEVPSPTSRSPEMTDELVRGFALRNPVKIDHKSTKVLMLDWQACSNLEEEKAAQKGAEGIISELREMQGEYAQLSELEEMERSYAGKLVESLKAVQTAVEDPIPIERAALGAKYRYVKEAFLASDAVVIMFNNTGISSAIPLSRFKSSEILSVVQSATPHLKKIIASKRRETGERVELLERILKEMKKTGTSVKRAAPEYQAPEEEDLVSSSITSE